MFKKLILLMCFLSSIQVMAAKEDEPILVKNSIQFISLNKDIFSIDSIKVPTDSHYFIYRNDNLYMTKVEKSEGNLKIIRFKNKKFESEKSNDKIEDIKSFTMKYINEIRSSKWSSNRIHNCKNQNIELNKNNELTIFLQQKGTIVLPNDAYLEYLNCNSNDSIVIGFIFCKDNGYCGQNVIGISNTKAKRSNNVRSDTYSLAAILSDGLASLPDAIEIKYGRIFDSDEDAVVFFTLEGFGGGNSHEQYIALFRKIEEQEFSGKQTKMYNLDSFKVIGARGWRYIDEDNVKIVGGKILANSIEQGPDDPMCCPSINSLIELTPKSYGEIQEKKIQ